MSNRFNLLVDEGDDSSEAVAEIAINKPTSTLSTAAPQPKQTQARPAKQAEPTPQPRGKPEIPGQARKRNNDRQQGNDVVEAEPAKDSRATRGGKNERFTAGKGPRGGRGGRGSGGNRLFDRHSMTGRTDSEKQDHQGWGGDDGKRELDAELDGAEDAKADASGVATPTAEAFAADGSAAVATTEQEPAAPAKPAEPEDNTKTYEEYLAEQKSTNGTLSKLGAATNIRQANEGADDAQWKDAVRLDKTEEEEALFVASKANKERKRPQKEGKQFLDIEPRSIRPPSDRGRGRGAPRGRSERGSYRGRGSTRGTGRGGSSNAAVDTSDATAFPSLG